MPHISIRVSEQEKKQMEHYAALHGQNLSDVIKSAFFIRLEDEFDLKLIEEYEADPDKTTYPHEEVKRMLGL
ncbi:MAG: DUF6290 family protein [Oscillospiraceae bacterium]|nr:DUF6290 family protein [Oscillospiraceae bacterium]